MNGIKRVLSRVVFERVLALILLIVFSPIMLLISIAIKVTSVGEVIFSQVRVGKSGKFYKIYKFRTMIENAEMQTGAIISWSGDPRVTSFGKFLRTTHLDELPQLFNVIKGDMSLIGPRPERPEMTKKFNKEIQNYILRERVRPGVSGLAQIALPYDAQAHEKLEYDLYHVLNKRSWKLYFTVAIYTLRKVLTSELFVPNRSFNSSMRTVSKFYRKTKIV